MSDERTTVKSPTKPTPIETLVTTEVPNAADVPTEELSGDDDMKKAKQFESSKS